jgi:hypothetical protein
MPATSIRDLVIHDDDVVVGTHGRGFWILDDMSPMRQLNPQAASDDVTLFTPRPTYRLPRDTNTDTPLPPEEPAAKNPPDGAILYYHLKSAASQVTLEILDANNRLVRWFTSADKPEPPEPQLNVPTYWIRPFQPLSTEAGMHRFIWDLHATPPAGRGGRGSGYPISAIYRDTPRSPQGEWMPPGLYTVRLTVDGRAYTQPLTIRPDPRR